jgi:acetylornithine deacetylase/succinyl-diaminopimelate desuccinylase-like protein
MVKDDYGNRILSCKDSRIMISTHTDTVHFTEGKQSVQVHNGIARTARSNCLGADDTAGIYAALRMIDLGVKATFVFHRDEEIGGLGSKWLARKYPEWLQEFDVCLALDRRGTSDIVTHQLFSRCASDLFAFSLTDQLDLGHQLTEGTYTDSVNYAHLIPECSNISVGYQNEHTPEEYLDIAYLEEFIERLVKVDWDELIVARNPNGRKETEGLTFSQWV